MPRLPALRRGEAMDGEVDSDNHHAQEESSALSNPSVSDRLRAPRALPEPRQSTLSAVLAGCNAAAVSRPCLKPSSATSRFRWRSASNTFAEGPVPDRIDSKQALIVAEKLTNSCQAMSSITSNPLPPWSYAETFSLRWQPPKPGPSRSKPAPLPFDAPSRPNQASHSSGNAFPK